MMKFALAGNPNCGKTTLYNLLTGSTAYVGNWPGVTVEKREGTYKRGEEPVRIVDLPGIYSLSPYTPEEVISRNFILDEKPECVINIVDATNLERNLYLTTQLMEIDVPVVIALNMMDAVEKSGDEIDAKELEKKIGLPVVAISALRGTGIKELMDRAISAAKQPRAGVSILHDSPLAHLVRDVNIALKGAKVEAPLFHAVKLAEMDEIEVKMHPELVKMVDEFKATFEDDTFGSDLEAVVADARYKYIAANYSTTYRRKQKEKLTKSDKADKILTHRIWGIPIFLVILFAVFHLTFSEDLFYISAMAGGLPTLEELGYDMSNPGVTLLACFYDGAVFSPGVILTNIWTWLLDWVGELLGLITAHAPLWVGSFIGDGIWGGLSAVLGFLPQILVLFLFFSILEDSGYMARVAFIMDRIFRKFGLSGRAFMPMIMGFGCMVPASVNTRTLADDKERTATIRALPMFACGAKAPIILAIAAAIANYFGVGYTELITYSMYIAGVVVAIVSVLLLRNTTLRGETPPFIMELPAYHLPLFKGLMIHLWDKTKHFVKKAFTIIFASTIVIWFLSSFGWSWNFLLEEVDGELVNLHVGESILGSLGKLIQPIFTPLGFGSQLTEWGWVFAVAVINGLIAKENVIGMFGTLATVLPVLSAGIPADGLAEGAADVMQMIQATGIGIPGLLAFIMFNVTTIPCFAACATARAELPKGKFKWTLLFWLGASYLTGTVFYLVGSWWWTLFPILAVAAAGIAGIVIWNKKHPVKNNEVPMSEESPLEEAAITTDEKENKL